MIVVADTSPINYLVLLGRVGVLQTLYDRILLPHTVLDELLRPGAPAPVRAWAMELPHWAEPLSPSISTRLNLPRLDPGEAEAIALAGELHADWLLIDDAAGRTEAVRRGLRTIGTLGILREAHRAGLLDLPETIRQLQDFGFYISLQLLEDLFRSID